MSMGFFSASFLQGTCINSWFRCSCSCSWIRTILGTRGFSFWSEVASLVLEHPYYVSARTGIVKTLLEPKNTEVQQFRSNSKTAPWVNWCCFCKAGAHAQAALVIVSENYRGQWKTNQWKYQMAMSSSHWWVHVFPRNITQAKSPLWPSGLPQGVQWILVCFSQILLSLLEIYRCVHKPFRWTLCIPPLPRVKLQAGNFFDK